MPTILITGVGTGLGRALALHAHAVGWRVFGTTRDERPAEALGMPAEITLFRLELRFPNAVRTFTERFLADHGVPDVLVNNAAIAMYGPVEDLSHIGLTDLFQVNVFSGVELIAGMLPGMRTRGSGLIVNITSLGGRMVFPFFTAYNASKFALEAFSEGLWHEVKRFGIRVKLVEPGYIDTSIYQVMEDARDPAGPYGPAMRATNDFRARLKRRSTPEDAALAVWNVITDPSDRLRYPVAAYAKPLLAARGLIGGQRFMNLMHRRMIGSRPGREGTLACQECAPEGEPVASKR